MSRTMNLTPKTAFECAPARNPGRAAAPAKQPPKYQQNFPPMVLGNAPKHRPPGWQKK